MGIRTFTFNGESSDTYGVMITQNESYNAPARAGEMVSIPGRNGAYWHDLGRFENIEVTYKCAIGEGTKADFVDAMSDIRAWLCSPIGYCRLEDDYNPNEYRLAVYKSGLETAEPFVTGAEFEITFDCKPQRFLKSGETAVSVTSGDTITNPTLFDAKPQLQVWGYGNIGIGSQTINIDDVVMGNILLANSTLSTTVTLDISNMMNGDQFTVSGISKDYTFVSETGYYSVVTIGTKTNCTAENGYSNEIRMYPSSTTFANGTSSAFNWSVTASVRVYAKKGSYDQTTSVTISGSVSYDGDNTLTAFATVSPSTVPYILKITKTNKISDIYGYSTKSVLGNPLYIDLDIGEAYNTDSGILVSVNDAVSIPAELPVLNTGANTITYDNTITDLKIIPRWWKV